MIVYLSQYSSFFVARTYVNGQSIIGYTGSPSTASDALEDLRKKLETIDVKYAVTRLVERDYRSHLQDQPKPIGEKTHGIQEAADEGAR